MYAKYVFFKFAVVFASLQFSQVRIETQKYVYLVRDNLKVSPADTSVLKHEEDPWLTLLTCQGYQEDTNTYTNRIAIRAVLAGTAEDTSTMASRIR